jgi:hypothetical protein
MLEADKMFMEKCSSLFTSEASVTNQKRFINSIRRTMAFFENETSDVLDLLQS